MINFGNGLWCDVIKNIGNTIIFGYRVSPKHLPHLRVCAPTEKMISSIAISS